MSQQNVDYAAEIQNLIRETIDRFTRYKQGVTTVNGDINQLLIDLRKCIDDLTALLGRYDSILRDSQGLGERLQMAMEEVEGEKRRCKDKLKQIYELFTQSITDLGTNDSELDDLKQLTEEIKTQIKDICAEIEKRLRAAERRSQEIGPSKEDFVADETKGEGREQPQQRQQRTARSQQRTEQLERDARDARAAQRRANMRAREQERNTNQSGRFGTGGIYGQDVQRRTQRDGRISRGGGLIGGWQTPQKLESISRYSPIRRVTRKKNNKKKKKKKQKKNTKTKKRRRKQTKRRGKKRN